MGCSIISKTFSRPSVIVLLGFILLAIHGTQITVSGNPVPDSDTAKNFLNQTTQDAKSFFERLKNTLSFKVDGDHPGLTTWELVGVIAAAVLLLLILPCCIGYCLCECVKELICCICCCGCCRD